MTLDELITALEVADPALAVQNGFANPHSYRGDYDELAFEPAANVTVGAMLDDARNARGATFQGYKGGDFTMGGDTDCWLAEYGSCGETIGALLIQSMLAAAVLPAPADRPAMLLWAADAIDAGMERFFAEWPDEPRNSPYALGQRDAATELRRLADEAQQPEAEAHRTLTEWIAEVLEDDGMWMYLGTGPDRSVAERRRASVTRRHPGAETRTVRKATTYTVVADDAQQPAPADRGTAAAIDETAATIQAEGV